MILPFIGIAVARTFAATDASTNSSAVKPRDESARFTDRRCREAFDEGRRISKYRQGNVRTKNASSNGTGDGLLTWSAFVNVNLPAELGERERRETSYWSGADDG